MIIFVIKASYIEEVIIVKQLIGTRLAVLNERVSAYFDFSDDDFASQGRGSTPALCDLLDDSNGLRLVFLRFIFLLILLNDILHLLHCQLLTLPFLSMFQQSHILLWPLRFQYLYLVVVNVIVKL